MSNNKIYTVARREFLDIVYDKNTLIAGLLFAAWFIWLHGNLLARKEADDVFSLFNSSMIYLTPMVGAFIGYIYSGKAFLFEKTEGIIETLLAAPLNLRTLWLGKAIGVALPAWIATLIFAIGFTALVQSQTGAAVMPTGPVIFHVLLIVPVFAVSFVGLIGFWQLVLGMRENQVVNLILFLGLFGGLSVSGEFAHRGLITSWQLIGLLSCIAVVMLGLTWCLGGVLSKERIVRSIQ